MYVIISHYVTIMRLHGKICRATYGVARSSIGTHRLNNKMQIFKMRLAPYELYDFVLNKWLLLCFRCGKRLALGFLKVFLATLLRQLKESVGQDSTHKTIANQILFRSVAAKCGDI